MSFPFVSRRAWQPLIHLFSAFPLRTTPPQTISTGQICGSEDRSKKAGRGDRCADSVMDHNFTRRRRKALVTTETELIAIAAPAKIGESSRPKNGYSTPAAIGTPNAL